VIALNRYAVALSGGEHPVMVAIEARSEAAALALGAEIALALGREQSCARVVCELGQVGQPICTASKKDSNETRIPSV
jgi:hypothetical protein